MENPDEFGGEMREEQWKTIAILPSSEKMVGCFCFGQETQEEGRIEGEI